MKYTTGFVKLACAWMVILLPRSDAGHALKKHGAAAAAAAAAAATASCKPKELTALTWSLVEKSLTAFDEANGKHLGTWSPGFPLLQVNEKSPLVPSKVQCSLLFMDAGLGEVLKDQKNNLNPTDVSLHNYLKHTIAQIDLLFKCLKHVLGGECSSKPTPPEMPQAAFQRKQWSHTLLKTSRDYLRWLEHKVQVKGTHHKERKVAAAKHQKYLEGSGYLL